jgi:hypothetical protein
MPTSRPIAAILPLALLAGFATDAIAVQSVDFANVSRNGVAAGSPLFVAAGDRVKFDAVLTANGAANPPGTSGLSLCLEYPRAAAGDPVIASVLATGNVANGAPTQVFECDAGNAAPIAGADFMVIEGWAAFSGGWPNVPLPVKLFDAQFTLPAAPPAPARIGFGATSVSAGETFAAGGPLLLCRRPTVTLAPGANGAETGPVPATFDVRLSTPVPAACGSNGVFAVTLMLGGTATVPGQPGADYTISGAGVVAVGANVTVQLPADGATTVRTVSATPIADGVAEGTESITLGVAAGSGNYDGVGAVATATISDSAPVAGVVVEYVDTADFPNAPGGHFFYSSDPAEQAAVDSGAAGQFHRTGRQFLTGGTAPVCRFYGSISPGPNSHFFTVDQAECNQLKAAQVVPTPTTVQQWNYERNEYLTTPVSVAGDGTRSCPAGTQPLYRAYNNAYTTSGAKNPWDSNHRFTPVQSDVAALVALGWRDEGIAFCTPAQ